MNIFFIYDCPIRSGQELCDQHTNKMLLETCQILATCFSLERLAYSDCPRTEKGTPRKHFNPNHPSCKWARQSDSNMEWLILHALSLREERINRGMNTHFCESFLDWVIKNQGDSCVKKGILTDFLPAINKKTNCYSIENFSKFSTTTKYKLYYKMDKSFASWKRNKPEWIDWEVDKIINVFEKCA